MSSIKGEINKRVFNNIEEINKKFGVNLKIPEYIPEGCNILCYRIEGLFDIKLITKYKETGKTLLYFDNIWFRTYSDNLEQEVEDDICNGRDCLIYLRLTQQEDDKPIFTPERLLGVETTLGFIVDVFGKDYTNPLTCFFFETTDGTSYSTYNDGVKFYISDDSDETVSFEEYVKLFYNTENT